ncbi:outer membrane protein assembly factor BamD [Novispirillum itersonii]|uniref:outer membrane protein assembly factor BamD n=1 Tax=Novispirillum itersonii TaxID=189 RepID=UPI000368967C|nr:outer membrane protein assembly factor BamD [Novispirillum itersonii]
MPLFSLRRLLPTLAALAVAGTLAACSGDKEPEYVEKPVTDLYNQAVDLMNEGEYSDAAKAFDEVERQHPYSKWATKAQLMAAFSYYQEGKYDDTIIALDRFIQLHPGSPDTPYAYYLKALCFYEQISDVGRDQKMTRLAQQALEEIVTRFPNTEYARDARLKLDLTQDHLAGKEMEVGRYYLKAGQYLAAINRFRIVVEKYDHTSHVPEALYRLTEAYTVIGLKPEAKKTAAVLGYNYPGSDWYDDAYDLVERGITDPASNNDSIDNSENSKSWLSKATSWF